MEPMLLKPVGKNHLWGGTRLKREYSKQINMEPLAETWECSAHPDGPSTIVNGKFAGMTLDKVLELHPEYLGTKIKKEHGLPILVKFIDADKDLSVQVHPDDNYARKYENQNGKTEMWYIMDAKPGASLVFGFAHDVTREQLEYAIKEGTLAKHLQKVRVQKGDVFFMPPGTVHAIGSGTLIAEIQQSSNVTYRVYDYERLDAKGQKRELHFDKALEVMNMKAQGSVRQKSHVVNYYPGCSKEILCRCKYFETEKIQMINGFSFWGLEASFQVLLCLEGEGEINTKSSKTILKFKKGDCIFLPAGVEIYTIMGRNTLLKVRC